MSSQVDTNTRTFEVDEAMAQFARIKMDADGDITYADASDIFDGTTQTETFAAGDQVAVKLRTASGTHKMIASGAITAAALVYGDDDGKISATATGELVGKALEAATADEDVIEVLVESGEARGDNSPQTFGGSSDVQMLWSTGDASNHAFVVALGDTNQAIHITDVGAKATDWALSAVSNPTLYIHSNTTPATDYLLIGGHDGTTATIDVVGGTTLSMAIAGAAIGGVKATGLYVGTYVVAGTTAGDNQLTLQSTGTAPSGTGANVGHLFADYETDDDELFWLSGTGGTSSQLTT